MALVVIGLTVAGCDDQVTRTASEPVARAAAGAPIRIRVVSGDSQRTTPLRELPDPIVVEVSDSAGPVAGVTVRFQPVWSEVGAAVSNPQAVTDAQGRASTRWTVSRYAAPTVLGATVGDLLQALATALVSPGPATRVVAEAGLQRVWLADSIWTYLSAGVRDEWDNPITGIAPTFVVDSGAGAILSLGPNSESTVRWQLDPVARRNVAHAEAVGLRSAPVVVIGTIGKFKAIEGDSQRTRPSKPVPIQPLLGAFNRDDKPLGAGFPLSFYTLNEFGGLDFLDSARTDAQGRARLAKPWVLGPQDGWNSLFVIGELEESTFRMFARGVAPKPERIAIRSGGQLRGTTGNFIPIRPEVVVLDSAGQPLPNQPIQIETIGPGGETKAFSRHRSDSMGLARVPTWRLSGFPGQNQLRLSTPGLPPAPVLLTATVDTVPWPAFTISTAYIGVFPIWMAPIVNAAARDWEQVVVGDLADVTVDLPASPGCHPAVKTTIDDILVFIRIIPIDGLGNQAAAARVCRFRDNSTIPLIASITIDHADLGRLESAAGLPGTLRHLLGHALGIGTSWEFRPDLADTTLGRYAGQSAIAAFNWLGWRSIPDESPAEYVPLDREPGGWIHWSSNLGADVMSAGQFKQSAISALSVSALRDLGYVVDDSRAREIFVPLPGGYRLPSWEDQPVRSPRGERRVGRQ